MQTITESLPGKDVEVPKDVRPNKGTWWPLILAALLLPFANGGHSVGLAAWLVPLFLLRFTRTHRPLVGITLAFAVQAPALMVQFRGMVPLPSIIYAIIIVFYAALYTLPYLGDRLLSPRLPGFASTLAFPLLWSAIEYLISLGPFGSWFASAYSQHGNLALLQLLSVTGLWGVSFLIAWTAAAGNTAWEQWTTSRRIPRVLSVNLAVLIAVFLAGGARLALFPPVGKTVRIASLSKIAMDLHPDAKIEARFFNHLPLDPKDVAIIRERSATIDEDLLRRSEREAQAGARIIFWGEANAPVLAEDENDLIRRGGEIAKNNHIYLGMVLAGWHLETTPPLENKIVLVQPDGIPAWEFYKAHPVPGTEAAISIKGDGVVRSLDTPYGRLSSIICFDADFPKLLAQAGHLHADIVLDPSNDWKAIDPWHTYMASFRAIEQGFNMVRHTSNGLSAAFDYQGRQLASMDHYVTDNRVLVAQVPTQGVRTLYGMWGDWFAWSCIAGLAGLVVLMTQKHKLE